MTAFLNGPMAFVIVVLIFFGVVMATMPANRRHQIKMAEIKARSGEEYKALNKIGRDDDVDPDGFAVWGFEQLLHHRVPLYDTIVRKHGYKVRMEDVPPVKTPEDFVGLICSAIDSKA